MMADGIPQLLNSVDRVVNTGVLLVSDAIIAINMFSPSQWGIYLNGAPVDLGDSIFALEHKHEWRISDYPMEQGAFESYNKVATPFDTRLIITKGGTDEERTIFLDDLNTMAADTNLYQIVTPDTHYDNVNISHIDYKRTSVEGVTLITASVWFQEIRVTVTTTPSNTATPAGATPAQTGQVQPQTPGPTVTEPNVQALFGAGQ